MRKLIATLAATVALAGVAAPVASPSNFDGPDHAPAQVDGWSWGDSE